jgi:hypothetical protein
LKVFLKFADKGERVENSFLYKNTEGVKEVIKSSEFHSYEIVWEALEIAYLNSASSCTAGHRMSGANPNPAAPDPRSFVQNYLPNWELICLPPLHVFGLNYCK